MPIRHLKTAAALGVAALVAVPLVAQPAEASTRHGSHPAPKLRVVKTLSSAYVGPLQFAVVGKKIFVADSFTSTLNLLGRSTPLATGPSPAQGGDLAGVAVTPDSRSLAYTTSNGDHTSTKLTILTKGKKPVVADLSGFERKHNPDGRTLYGVDYPSSCVSKALTALDIPVSYRGDIDSHPYATTYLGNGSWAVADAGGNDVLKVDRHGHISVLSVLPRQPVKITKAFAAANGLPACAVGVTYNFEPVPTDVELGPHGALYATTLPGGPEGPSGGNPGSVYWLNSHLGKPLRIATGFAGATNLAVDSHGKIYVAEITTGTVSLAWHGHPKKVLTRPGVVALEFANGHLYASTAPAASGGSGPGQILLLGH
ncbi:MAG: ScyD/ScyE family protein [Frankiales bacterium]|nr:ScyD/ScyE family protein [Frankiales bacterium]